VTLGDCDVVDGGVVFRQCLPHKGMRCDIARPQVLLLDDALTFEGGGGGGGPGAAALAGSGGGGRVLSLDTLLEQERRYTDILVAKVLAHEPDVLLTSGSVSRLALDLLRAGHVSVVTHVRPSVMQRLSRLTCARIGPSI
jgi:1-phosphatidylinositol-3-phosphate 5-kinase